MGATLTPMLRQYKALKHEHPDAILLYRMGDFYEMFYEDAQHASRLLELTLTARGKGTQNAVPMCGFPHHQLEPYTARLIKADQRVAICDQVEDPKQAKGLVKREVVRIVTPGTMTDPTQLDAKSNVWIASAFKSKDRVAAAFLDLSTGEFFAWDRTATGSNDPDAWRALADRLRTFAPREVLLPDSFAEQALANSLLNERAVAKNVDDYLFQYDASRQALERQLKVGSLDGFGFRDRTAAVCAAGALLQYVQETQRHDLKQIHQLNLHDPATSLSLDAATQRNLEIERSASRLAASAAARRRRDHTATRCGRRVRLFLSASRDHTRTAPRCPRHRTTAHTHRLWKRQRTRPWIVARIPAATPRPDRSVGHGDLYGDPGDG
jgi:DNA mismatch repair protein MutS